MIFISDKQIYNEYLKLKEKIINGEISKKEVAIKLGFGNVKRPDMKLSKWLKSYELSELKEEHITHHITPIDKEKQVLKQIDIKGIPQNYFNNDENIKSLYEIIENHKNSINTKDNFLEILETKLPKEYKHIKNTQKSVRFNINIFKDWEKIMRTNSELVDLPQSQLLNLTLLWAIDKIKNK